MVRLAPSNWFKPSSIIFLLSIPRPYFFCGSFVFFVSCVSHAFSYVHCCLVVTCWERTGLLALVGDVYCIFVTFPCGILGQVLDLIVSFPDLCHFSYFVKQLVIKHATCNIPIMLKSDRSVFDMNATCWNIV